MAYIFFWLKACIRTHYRKRINNKKVLAQLFSLSEQERKIISRFLESKQKTCYIPLLYIPSHGLVDKGILEMGSFNDKEFRTPFTITDVVWKYLSKPKNSDKIGLNVKPEK